MRKGFTLIELMIVIIIIGILAVVGVTQFTGGIAKAKNAQAKAVLTEMRKAALAYQSVEGAWPTDTEIIVDLDADGTSDITFNPPTTLDFTYSITAGVGEATKTSAAGGGVSSWQIDFEDGTISEVTK